MDKEKFERAYEIRLKIDRIKEEKMRKAEGVDLDNIKINQIVVVVSDGPDLVINSAELMPEIKALIKSGFARYDKEIERLEKEFEEL